MEDQSGPEDCGDEECDPEARHFVASYLSSHPEFAKQWFSENACQEMVAEWMAARGLPFSDMWSLADHDHDKSLSESYKKVAQTGRNSVTSELFRDIVSGPRRNRKFQCRMSQKKLQTLHEHDLLMELIRDIANELDIDTVCHKILVNVSILTNSDRGSLFLAKGSRGKRYLVAKLFDVTQNSVLEESLLAAEEQTKIPPIPFGVGIAGHTAETKETVNIKDAYQDPRFNKEIDSRTGYRTISIMCMPILNFQGDVVGVAQCVNKASGDQEFTEQDEEVFRKYLTFCGIGIQNAQLFEMSVQEYKRNQVLLSLAQSIFEESSSLDRLIHRIIVKAQSLLQCQECRVYLVDTDNSDRNAYHKNRESGPEAKVPSIFKPRKFSKPEDVVFTTVFELRSNNPELRRPSLQDVPVLHHHLARYVTATGQTFNWTGEESDEDEARLLLTSIFVMEGEDLTSAGSVVSIPIFSSEAKVIGVAQLVNRTNGENFKEVDINTFEAFAIFCGLGIYNTQMYESAIKLMAKQRVALEVLSYHASSSIDETNKLVDAKVPSTDTFDLYSFDFSDFGLSDDDTCKAALRMFMELDLIAKFHIPYQVMCRWILTVKKNYRPVIYHNWRHALNVAQTMFAMLTVGTMHDMMSDLEAMALLVACFSHDLDHRGTNNSFQTKIDSPLATLYTTSTMEHHHFDHCIMILNSEGNNILQSLSPEDYRVTIRIIETAILSTDLALYFRKKDDFVMLVESRDADWHDPGNAELLRGMMMTACDVSAICKPWEIQRQVAELVTREFFEQGDLERKHLKKTPSAMMDRERKDELPKMQLDFIDCICIPVYKVLSDQWPDLTALYEGCLRNRGNWELLMNRLDLVSPSSNGSATDALTSVDRQSNCDSSEADQLPKKDDNAIKRNEVMNDIDNSSLLTKCKKRKLGSRLCLVI